MSSFFSVLRRSRTSTSTSLFLSHIHTHTHSPLLRLKPTPTPTLIFCPHPHPHSHSTHWTPTLNPALWNQVPRTLRSPRGASYLGSSSLLDWQSSGRFSGPLERTSSITRSCLATSSRRSCWIYIWIYWKGKGEWRAFLGALGEEQLLHSKVFDNELWKKLLKIYLKRKGWRWRRREAAIGSCFSQVCFPKQLPPFQL